MIQLHKKYSKSIENICFVQAGAGAELGFVSDLIVFEGLVQIQQHIVVSLTHSNYLNQINYSMYYPH